MRLDKLVTQLKVVLESPRRLNQAERLDLWEKAVTPSIDPEMQQRVLRLFAAEALGAKWPRIRITVNYEDLGRIREGIEAHPLQFVLQAFFVVATLHKKAGIQPRGRTPRDSTRATQIAFFACVADAFLRRGGSGVQAVRVLAAKAGYDTRLGGQLQLIYFLVERALWRQSRISLSESLTEESAADYRAFARTYLYPHRADLSVSAAEVAASPLLMQMFFGLDAPA